MCVLTESVRESCSHHKSTLSCPWTRKVLYNHAAVVVVVVVVVAVVVFKKINENLIQTITTPS